MRHLRDYSLVLLAALSLGGCAKRVVQPESVILPEGLAPSQVVGAVLSERPDVLMQTGSLVSADRYSHGRSSYAKVIPFFGPKYQKDTESWLHRIEGKKGSVVALVDMTRLNRGPWTWEVKEVVGEKEFLARYEEKPRTKTEEALDLVAVEALGKDQLILAATGTIQQIQVLQPKLLSANKGIDFEALMMRPDKDGNLHARRSYLVTGPSGSATVQVRFNGKSDSAWLVDDNGIVVRPAEQEEKSFPPPSRLSIYTAE
ncbi:hypothetical protein GC173_09950 [bacterium]|nr:hypothetical protein [bacterium]